MSNSADKDCRVRFDEPPEDEIAVVLYDTCNNRAYVESSCVLDLDQTR